MPAHSFNFLPLYDQDRMFHGRNTVHLLLDEHCFTDAPEDDFVSPSPLFAAIRDRFEGKWTSRASAKNTKLTCIIWQR